MTPLRKRMLEDLQIRNYSPHTVAPYIRRVAAEFAKHFGKSPELLGPEEIREYQLYLIKEKTVSLSAYFQTVCGLRFLYSNTPAPFGQHRPHPLAPVREETPGGKPDQPTSPNPGLYLCVAKTRSRPIAGGILTVNGCQ
jgi:hypothetical protein